MLAGRDASSLRKARNSSNRAVTSRKMAAIPIVPVESDINDLLESQIMPGGR
jgi:hypothetical protein